MDVVGLHATRARGSPVSARWALEGTASVRTGSVERGALEDIDLASELDDNGGQQIPAVFRAGGRPLRTRLCDPVRPWQRVLWLRAST
jgi:hypothetical protein